MESNGVATAPRKAHRPRKEIDQKLFERACKLLCSELEICSLLDIGEATLHRWVHRTYGKCFEDVYKTLSADGRMSLRRNLFRLSKTSASAAIFLAKNQLGMRDDIGLDIDGTPKPIVIEVTGEACKDRLQMIEASITKPDEDSKTV